MSQNLTAELVDFLSTCVTEKRRELFETVADQRTRHLRLVLDRVEDPHDANAVMRSVECFGVQDMHIIAARGDFKLVTGVAVGASKWLTVHRHQDGEDPARQCMDELEAAGYSVVAVAPDGDPLEELPLERPLAICLGAASGGLSREVGSRARYRVRLEARGFIGTFNLSVCAALVLSRLRERMAREDIDWRLPEDELLALRLDWLSKMPKRIKQLTARFLAERGSTLADLEAAAIDPTTLKRLIGA